jgi:hypothetical protein
LGPATELLPSEVAVQIERPSEVADATLDPLFNAAGKALHPDTVIMKQEAASRTSRSSKNNRFPYIFHWLVVSCKFRSIFFAKLVRQI